MGKYDDDFFEGKRPWSLIKDQVLSAYMPAYINKVKQRGKPIILIDGYAGPGVFKDGTRGSPLIICSAAEQYAKGSYEAHFVNIKKDFHASLEAAIQHAGWSHSAHCYHANSTKYIKQMSQNFEDRTVFLYLDPFGLKGCGFDQLEPFLSRNPSYSTEIVFTICMPVLHRLAGYKAIKEARQNDRILPKYHHVLTTVLGDDSWKQYMLQDIEAETKEKNFIEAYLNKINDYMPFTGYCPVRYRGRVKYFIVFASRHPHAMLLMNDNMAKAYFTAMHKTLYTGTLFEDFSWQEMSAIDERAPGRLNQIILDLVTQYPGMNRDEIWLKLIQRHFMRFLHSEYLGALKNLQEDNTLLYSVDSKTKRHNGSSRLKPLF